MSLSKDEAQKYSPTLGNAKPFVRKEDASAAVQDDEGLPEEEFKGF